MRSNNNLGTDDHELTDITDENDCLCNMEEGKIPDPTVRSNETEPLGAIRKKILDFSWPCVAELFLGSLISMISLIMVGHLGAYAISAVGITNQPVFISIAVFQSFNIGATALVARFMGAKDYKNAKLVVVQALTFAVISGTVLCIVGFAFSRWIVVAMGAQEDTVVYAELYMKYMCIGMIFQAVPTAVSSLLRGAGDTKSPMIYNLASNLINIAIGPFLIYGFWFIPGMGVKGAAIAATVAKIVACAMSIYMIFNSKLPIAVSLKDKFRLDFPMLKRIMNIGYAAAGEQLVLRVGLLTFTKMVADLGTISFAAHQIGINVIGLSFNVGQALGMTATSFMGRNLGAKRPDLAETYGREIRRMGMLASVLISVCFILFGNWIARLYTTDPAVIQNVSVIMIIIALIVPAQNSQLIIAGGLRGAGDTKWPFIATLAGILFIRMILAFFLIKVFMLALIGAWIAMAIDQFVRSVVIYFRFQTGKWKYIRV